MNRVIGLNGSRLMEIRGNRVASRPGFSLLAAKDGGNRSSGEFVEIVTRFAERHVSRFGARRVFGKKNPEPVWFGM
jgi:hypothetical protein